METIEQPYEKTLLYCAFLIMTDFAMIDIYRALWPQRELLEDYMENHMNEYVRYQATQLHGQLRARAIMLDEL